MRFAVKSLLCCCAGIVLVFLIVEMVACHRYRNLHEINMTGIDRDRIALKIEIRKAAKTDRQTENIPFYAEEGPFWFAVNEDFTDLQICSCRTAGIMVVYPCFDIPSKSEKTKILQMLKMKYRKKRANEDAGGK